MQALIWDRSNHYKASFRSARLKKHEIQDGPEPERNSGVAIPQLVSRENNF